MQAEGVRSPLQEKLPGTQMEVRGEGCNSQLNLTSDGLAGQSPVKRQRQVYVHLDTWVADGSAYAVTMKFFSCAAWAECS